MTSQIDNEKLKQDLMSDLSQAEDMAKQSSRGRGAPEMSDFSPRALRVKNKAVGQKELEDANNAINSAIKHLVGEANFADSVQAQKYENDLRKQFNQYKLYMIRQAGQAKKDMAKRQIDEMGSSKAMDALAGLAGGITSGIIGKIKVPKGVQTLNNSGGLPGLAGGMPMTDFGHKGLDDTGGIPGLSGGKPMDQWEADGE